MEFLDRNFLTQVVNQPTRGGSTLDLVFTNVPRYVSEVKVNPTPLSDHDLVEIQLGFNMISSKEEEIGEADPHSFRAVNYHKADYEAISRSLAEVDWMLLWELCDGDLNSFLELLKLTVLQITLQFSPKKESAAEYTAKKRRANKHVYVMKRKRRKINARIRALQEHNPSSSKIPKLETEVSLLCYQIQEGTLAKLNQKEHRAVETIKKNPKYFFSYAKRLQKTRSTIPVLRDEEGTLVEDPTRKAEILQRQYQKVFSNPMNADIDQCLNTQGLPQGRSCGFNEISFSRDDIVEALGELDPYSAAPDGEIPARILTACKQQLADPLDLFWQESFRKGSIPEELKTQYITPIFKKGDRTDPANYRPVSLTSHIMKTFERVVRKHLVL